MHVLASTVLALSLAAPDPRTINPDASRPDIVTEGGAATPVVIPTVPPPTGTPPPPPPTEPATPPTVPPPAGQTDAPSTTPPPGTPPGGQPKVAPKPKVEGPPVDRTLSCKAARGRCRRLKIAGFATLGVGAGLLGAGIGLSLVEPFPIDSEPAYSRSLAAPGKALIGGGAVALLAGGLLIGAGIAIHRKFQSGEEQLARVRLDAAGLHW